MKEAAENSEDFPWSLNRISQIVSWCKLVRLVSICRAGHAGHGWNTTVSGVAPGRKAAGATGVLLGHTQMLTMLTVEHPTPFFPCSYLKRVYKYLSSCAQCSEVSVMSTIHNFLQQREKKQMRFMIFSGLTFPSCHRHCQYIQIWHTWG